jgi:hypothetical protein
MTITFLASPYHTAGRAGAKITDIVLHWMDGTLATTDAEFTNGSRRVSAHYGIEDGTVHQYVHDADTAWHAGNWTENTQSIGIEHSAAPGRDASPATIASSVALIVTLCREYQISPDHIYPHNKFFATACPGTLPIADIIARVRAQLATPPPEDDMFTDADRSMLQTAYKLLQEQQLRNAPVVAAAVAGLPAATAKAVVAALPVTPGGSVDVAAIAKAVNDDAARRMLS